MFEDEGGLALIGPCETPCTAVMLSDVEAGGWKFGVGIEADAVRRHCGEEMGMDAVKCMSL